MHMSDALVSPPVFAVAGAVSVALLAVAVRKTGRTVRSGLHGGDAVVPLMGVMGAFVFAAQMINFSIPGTGSSGHLVGGVLLAAVLGPWPAFLTLASVLTLQCLLFADGGVMALGCNIFNMAALSCLGAYPLLFRPIVRCGVTQRRLFAASAAACVAALAAGALAVTAETVCSGIAALPAGRFLAFMLPIHLVIGLGEGAATGAVLGVLLRSRPALLADAGPARSGRPGRLLIPIAAAALLLGASFAWVASSDPDGLEWSIEHAAERERPAPEPADGLHALSSGIQRTTALMPGYDTSLAGIAGSGIILLAAFGTTRLLRVVRRRSDGKGVARHS